MYKQKCCGSRGPLIPAVVAASIALILYSALDTAMKLDKTSPWFYVGLALFFSAILYIVWRYFVVTYEYLWISGDLIIRQYIRGKVVVKCSISGDKIVGMWHFGEKIPVENHGFVPKNYCATIPGILMKRSTLVYHGKDGRVEKLFFEPSEELKTIVKNSIRDKIAA